MADLIAIIALLVSFVSVFIMGYVFGQIRASKEWNKIFLETYKKLKEKKDE